MVKINILEDKHMKTLLNRFVLIFVISLSCYSYSSFAAVLSESEVLDEIKCELGVEFKVNFNVERSIEMIGFINNKIKPAFAKEILKGDAFSVDNLNELQYSNGLMTFLVTRVGPFIVERRESDQKVISLIKIRIDAIVKSIKEMESFCIYNVELDNDDEKAIRKNIQEEHESDFKVLEKAKMEKRRLEINRKVGLKLAENYALKLAEKYAIRLEIKEMKKRFLTETELLDRKMELKKAEKYAIRLEMKKMKLEMEKRKLEMKKMKLEIKEMKNVFLKK